MCRAVCKNILEKKYICFCSFGTRVFLLMLRNNLIYIEFYVPAYHFKLVTIVWTLLTRLARKFLDFRRDLFLTLEELTNFACQLQNTVCHTFELLLFSILKLYFRYHHPNSDSFLFFFQIAISRGFSFPGHFRKKIIISILDTMLRKFLNAFTLP